MLSIGESISVQGHHHQRLRANRVGVVINRKYETYLQFTKITNSHCNRRLPITMKFEIQKHRQHTKTQKNDFRKSIRKTRSKGFGVMKMQESPFLNTPNRIVRCFAR